MKKAPTPRRRHLHVYPGIPRWTATLYGFLALVILPWTIWLAITLPPRQVAHHWDVAWVGFDVGLMLLLLLTAVFAYFKSKWIALSAMATSVMLVIDAWFDIWNARPGTPLNQAVFLALVFELPLAIITFVIACKIIAGRAD